MRVLLDEQLPRQLRHLFPGHFARTVRQQGWTGCRNGDLLRRAEAASFEVFVTADQSLQFQHNLANSSLRIIVMAARSTRLQDLLPLIPRVLTAVDDAAPGEIQIVRPG